MLDVVEPRHVAALLSPFERVEDSPTPDVADIASLLGLPQLGEFIMVPASQLPEFELARQRLLDEPI